MFLHWRTHWRNLANTIKPSVCCGDAALCQITSISSCTKHRVKRSELATSYGSRVFDGVVETASYGLYCAGLGLWNTRSLTRCAPDSLCCSTVCSLLDNWLTIELPQKRLSQWASPRQSRHLFGRGNSLPKLWKFSLPNFRCWPKLLDYSGTSVAETVNKRFSTTLTSLAVVLYKIKILVSFIIQLLSLLK